MEPYQYTCLTKVVLANSAIGIKVRRPTTRHCRRRVVVVGGGAMVGPRGRGSLEHHDWAAKEEVSKKKKGRENIPAVYQEGEPAHGAEATGMLHDLGKKKN